MRRSGIILPIFSLPSNYGIGTFGEEAYKFVNFLDRTKQSYWQILPIGPTSYGDSPYQSFSTFAGNPYFIDLDILIEDGILEKRDVKRYNCCNDENYVDYDLMYRNRYKILKKAYKNANIRYQKELDKFKLENSNWINDYSFFMALKDHYKGIPWKEWDKDIKCRQEEALNKYYEMLKYEINFYVFLQYLFYNQWDKLKKYANEKGIEIIGDIPIYVAEDSADVWANPQYFMLDKELNPTEVAGCPPDAFSDTGQLWGNPIYDWNEMKKDKYSWWVERVKASLKIFDVVRIDHFRGFESYWSIPYGDKTAINGQWKKGPDIEIFKEIKNNLGEINIIAEDLGYITKEVRDLLEACDYPGMKVLQFAFDPSGESEYLPHNYGKNTVVYTGTHDNDTIKGWFKSLSKEEKIFCKKYTGMKNSNDNWALIKCAISSTANTAILQMQDILNLDKEARTNIPSTLGTNWRWRLSKEYVTTEQEAKLIDITKLYGRAKKE